MEVPQKPKIELSYNLAFHSWEYIWKKKKKENTSLRRYMHPSSHSSTIYNRKGVKNIYISVHQQTSGTRTHTQ